MDNLLLHPKTKTQLKNIIHNTPHGLLISGKQGAGKETIAESVARHVLEVPSLLNHPYVYKITPVKHSIGIESIRSLNDFLGRKTTGKGSIRRVILIIDSQFMTSEAQNALLKPLEEPPEDTVIIMTSSDPEALKPTIRSRTQQLIVMPIALPAAQEYFTSKDYQEAAIKAAFYMSDGGAGLMSALLDQSAEHEHALAINEAKKLLALDTYHKLLQTDSLSKDKESLAALLEASQRVIISGLRQSASNRDKAQTTRLHSASKQLQKAQIALAQNGNVKLVLTDLFLSL